VTALGGVLKVFDVDQSGRDHFGDGDCGENIAEQGIAAHRTGASSLKRDA